MMKKQEKKRLGLWLAISAAAVFICAVVSLCVILLSAGQQDQPAERIIYWNVDRQAFINAETGLNNRTANASGYFPIVLSFNGEQKEFLAVDKPLVAEMDSLELFGIVQDENGIIVDIQEIEEFTGGYVAERFYVESVTEDSFTANSSKTLKGESATFSLKNVQVYNVVGEGLLVGMPTQLRKNDRIMGIVDTEGNLTHVYVVETMGPSTTRYCDHCEMEVDWVGWTNAEAAPNNTGHYYLNTDVQLKYQLSIAAEQTIVLDLNGHKITGAEGRRVVSLHNEGVYFGVMDYSREQTGKIEAWGQGAHVQGACVWVRYGMFEMFSGTLDASRVRTDLYGVAVCVNKETIMNMYGGTIIGGTSTSYTNPKTGKKMGAYGGSVYCDGTLNISGGVIRKGIAEGYVDKADGKYKRGAAGNVYISMTGTLNMTGGSILDGFADGDGGNLYVSGVANISGNVTISGGTAKQEGKRGGNILVGSAGKLTMTGGEITNGTSGGSGGNIYSAGNSEWIGVTVTGGKSENTQINNISAYKNTCLIKDCTVDGDVFVAKECKLTLAGATKISKGQNYGLKITNDVMIVPDELTQGADIVLTATGYFTEKTNTSAASFFKLSCEGDVLAAEGRLFAGKRYCLCGKAEHDFYCDGTMLLWQAWTDSERMPGAEGNFYLTSNVKLAKRATVGKAGGAQTDARKVMWDLNGYTVTGAEGSRVAFVTGYSTLAICDTSDKGTGKLQATGTCTENGHAVFGGSGTVINIYGGRITGGKVEAILKTATDDNGTVTVKATNGQGGNLYSYGVVNMYGGIIADGVAKSCYDEATKKYSYGYGGNIALAADAQFYFHSGTICNGVADQNGGNLYTAANVTMTGGTISGGTVQLSGKSGGNVYLTGTAIYDMQGGTITGGKATSNGGNVMSYGQFNLSGGSVVDGTASNLGGNLCVGGSGAAAVSGGVISGGFAKHETDAQGNAVLEKTAATANIIAMKDSAFTITGGQIAGGVRVLDGSTLTLGGSPVIEGISLGGNVQATINGILGENTRILLTKDRNGYFAITADAENANKFSVQEGYMAEFDKTAGMLKIVKAPVVSDHNHCNCAGGASRLHTCENVGFLPWGNEESEKSSLPVSGSYYLTCDIVLVGSDTGTGICKVESMLNLCLNGYQITTTADCSRRMFHISGGTLNITDCSEGKTGTIAAGYETYTAEGGLMLVGSKSELNLYAGTLTGTNLLDAGKNGGTLRSYGTINIYGGTVTGGTAVNGGNIAAGGPLNIYGGTVTGGIATGNGGNIWISSNVDVLVCDAQITSGTAAKGGGLYVNGNVTLSGAVNITGNTGSNLYIPNGKQIAVGELAETASVGVSANGSFAMGATEQTAQRFTPDDNSLVREYLDGVISLVIPKVEPDHPHNEGVVNHCFCGGNNSFCTEDHQTANLTWTPWTGTETDGYYYLDQDLTLNLTEAIKILKNHNLYLCLNGHTLSVEGYTLFMLQGTNRSLNICDCSVQQTGTITTSYAATSGSLIRADYGIVNIYGGTLTGTGTSTSAYGFVRAGGTSSSANYSGVINMYGGTISGCGQKYGGSVYVTKGCEFNLYDGLITGGSASVSGGNVYTAGAFNMYAGSITEGTADSYGGNVFVTATGSFLMQDGEISGGAATNSNSSNVAMTAAGLMDLRGGVIKGYVRVTAGTLNLSGTITILGEGTANLSVKTAQIIQITGALTGTQQIGIKADTEVFATGVEEDVSGYFVSDDGNKNVTYDPETKELKLV